MKSVRLIIAIPSLIVLLSMARVSADEIPDWVVADLVKWYEAYNTRDAEALAALYTEDAEVGEAIGRNEIMADFQQAWADRNHDCTGKHTAFVMLGNIAAASGEDICTPRNSNNKTIRHVKWMSILERQEDGRWLMLRDASEVLDE